jgi:hypothetical protein
MVKAFQVAFSEDKTIYTFGYSNTPSITSYGSYSNNIKDDRPIMVIANNIKEVADKYPNAVTIMEHDMKEVVILDSVKIVCPVRS